MHSIVLSGSTVGCRWGSHHVYACGVGGGWWVVGCRLEGVGGAMCGLGLIGLRPLHRHPLTRPFLYPALPSPQGGVEECGAEEGGVEDGGAGGGVVEEGT